MLDKTKNEDWLLAMAAREVRKQVEDGYWGLSDWERLVLCVWTAYDALAQHRDDTFLSAEFPQLRADGASFAQRLGLTQTASVFDDLVRSEFFKVFKIKFDTICDELRSVCEARRA